MTLQEIYAQFYKVAKSKNTPENYKKYKKLAAQVFPLLKTEYEKSGQKVKAIDDIYQSLEDESKDMVKFWGSEKIALKNHCIYVVDKNSRLFEQLRKWYEVRNDGFTKMV